MPVAEGERVDLLEAAGADTADFRPAPPRPKEPEEKSSTMRIELPPGLGVPETPRRRIVFRRGSK